MNNKLTMYVYVLRNNYTIKKKFHKNLENDKVKDDCAGSCFLLDTSWRLESRGRTKAKSMKEHFLLACYSWFIQLAFFSFPPFCPLFPASQIDPLSNGALQIRTGLRETTVKQDKIRYGETRQMPSD